MYLYGAAKKVNGVTGVFRRMAVSVAHIWQVTPSGC